MLRFQGFARALTRHSYYREDCMLPMSVFVVPLPPVPVPRGSASSVMGHGTFTESSTCSCDKREYVSPYARTD